MEITKVEIKNYQERSEDFEVGFDTDNMEHVILTIDRHDCPSGLSEATDIYSLCD